jgi:hypothetical protein
VPTEQITIFATVQVPVIHPVFAAKALVTVDHVTRGRAGLKSSPAGISFKQELPFFIDRVVPLLRRAGLRQ